MFFIRKLPYMNIVLDATKGIKYMPPPCGTSCNPEYRFLMLVVDPIVIFAITALFVNINIIIIIMKLKHHKEKM